MGSLGFIETLLLIALLVSVLWVFNDAPKYGINKYIAILAIIVLIYPIGFVIYLFVTRIFRKSKYS
jgi:uncharacterized membrane protein YqjE